MTPVETSQVFFNVAWSVVAVLIIAVLVVVSAATIKLVQLLQYSAQQMQEFWEDARMHLSQFSALAGKLGKLISFFGKKKDTSNSE